MTEWLYEKEMEQAIGLIFQVRNELGAGWSEEIYHQALVYLFQKHRIPVLSKPRQTLVHRGTDIHTFEPDLILWDKLILELKVLLDFEGKHFPTVNQAQLLHYLKFHDHKLGVLVNLAHSKVGIKRIIFDAPPMQIKEDYERMLPYISAQDRVDLRQVLRCIKTIATQYGLGYPETLYRKLIAVELQHHQIACQTDLKIDAMFDQQRLGQQSTAYLLVANRFLLQVRSSLKHIPAYNYNQTRTFLKALDLKVGWIINFGHKSLQIHATIP